MKGKASDNLPLTLVPSRVFATERYIAKIFGLEIGYTLLKLSVRLRPLGRPVYADKRELYRKIYREFSCTAHFFSQPLRATLRSANGSSFLYNGRHTFLFFYANLSRPLPPAVHTHRVSPAPVVQTNSLQNVKQSQEIKARSDMVNYNNSKTKNIYIYIINSEKVKQTVSQQRS